MSNSADLSLLADHISKTQITTDDDDENSVNIGIYENGMIRWGFDLDRSTEGRIEGVKLLLDPDQPRSIYIPAVDTKAELRRLGKPAIAVATDFINALWTHASANIESKYLKDYFNLLKKKFVLTVPAVRSEKAQDATLRAARNAGLAPVKLIKEPEAAALFTLHHMGDKGLAVGDGFVVCDAGGGTVDLISYEITSLKPIELKELVGSTGGLAGSLMLNRRFEDHVKNVVGEKEFIRLREQSCYALGMKHFDQHVKTGFHTSDLDEQYINFPKAGLKARPDLGLFKDTITIKRTQLYEIFNPIILDIERLVSEQINQARLKRIMDQHPKGKEITAIFLVGGFGASAYLYSRIKAKHPDIRVIQPNDAWSAIVRGAVMYNSPNEPVVVSNVATKHYGVIYTSYDIDPIQDKDEKKIYSHHYGEWGVERIMWYIHQGDDLQRARPIEINYNRSFDENPPHSQLQVEDTLWQYDRERAPRHPKGSFLKLTCKLNTDLSVLPKDYFEKRSRRKPDGRVVKWWQLGFKLVVTVQSGPLLFSLKCRGKEYAVVEAKY